MQRPICGSLALQKLDVVENFDLVENFVVTNFSTKKNSTVVKFLWFEKRFAVQLDMVVNIDILQFQPNWCRITACHAILLIGYYAKNGKTLLRGQT